MNEKLDEILQEVTAIKNSAGMGFLVFFCLASSVFTCSRAGRIESHLQQTNIYLREISTKLTPDTTEQDIVKQKYLEYSAKKKNK